MKCFHPINKHINFEGKKHPCFVDTLVKNRRRKVKLVSVDIVDNFIDLVMYVRAIKSFNMYLSD
jgi:hypothetical protein